MLLVSAVCAAPASATMTAGPLGGRETESWSVGQPACSIEHDWQKQPTAFDVQSVAFKAAVSCASIPPNITVYGTLNVYDQNAGLSGKRVIHLNASLASSSSPASFSLTPVYRSPRAGQVYQSEFLVTFYDSASFSPEVSGTPPQCMRHDLGSDPFNPDPTQRFGGGTVDCQFLEELAVP